MKNLITPIFYFLIVTNIFSQQTKTIYVDESYDEILDQGERMQAILAQLKHIMDTYTLEQFQEKINSDAVQEIIQHNKQQYQTILTYLEKSTGIFSWTEYSLLNKDINI